MAGRLVEGPPAEHECAKPMRPVYPPGVVPSGPGAPSVPPAVGSTWDCPVCGRVWIVREVRVPGPAYGRTALVRRWQLATKREEREHHTRAAEPVPDHYDPEVVGTRGEWRPHMPPPPDPGWPPSAWVGLGALGGALSVWGALALDWRLG